MGALLGLALSPALLACTPPPKPPAPERLRVIVPPSAAPLLAALSERYHAHRSYMTVETSERNAAGELEAVATGEADLAFIERTLDPAEALDPETTRPRLRAWPVGTGAIAIIVNAANPVANLSLDQVRRAFAGVETQWANLGGEDLTLRLVSREAGAPLRECIEQQALRGGTIAGTAIVMPSDEAVAGYVATHPEAIGYVGASWVGDGVKALTIDAAPCEPAAVASGAYPLTYPLVIVTPTAISGKAKDLIDFVYGPEGRAILGEGYAMVEGN